MNKEDTTSDSININNKNLDYEYDNYRKSLVFIKECPACHYIQGMIFAGISIFTAARMQFIWQSLKWRHILLYTGICLGSSLMATYKVTYAYHVYKIQTSAKKTFGNNNASDINSK
jgi:hypothetical protein